MLVMVRNTCKNAAIKFIKNVILSEVLRFLQVTATLNAEKETEDSKEDLLSA